jgi:hypothetical protein
MIEQTANVCAWGLTGLGCVFILWRFYVVCWRGER